MTNKRYFETCETLEDVKQVFKKLARELHPDCNPGKDTTADFQDMQKQYEEAFANLKNYHRNSKGETYTKETDEVPADFANMIFALLHYPGLVIELCGSWLWVTGSTKLHKEELKALGFKYSANKAAWYFHNGEYHKRGKGAKSMDTIRSMYGSQRFTEATRTEEPKEITA